MPTIERVTPVIGLEVHVELATRSKMFSRAPNPASPDAPGDALPNTLLDPVVLALPGTLPVMNKAAVELAMLVGLALGCRIAPRSRWDRKSYFYPDLPKAYQISQYDQPLCTGGAVDLPAPDASGFPDPAGAGTRIRIARAHLEEDAGKLLHEAPGGHAIDHSIVDLNRAGAPLLEIVTEPDLGSAAQAVLFARVLHNLCRFLGATPGVLQKGHMRFEPNVNCRLSLSDGRTVATPIVEVKNLNSFRALRDAIEFELREQPRRWEEDGRESGPGAKVTRGWDDARSRTFVQREKEDAHDYRYFPDPDLVPVEVDGAWLGRVRGRLPELPLARLRRYTGEYGLGAKESWALIEERPDSDYFEQCVAGAASRGVSPPAAAGKGVANILLQHGLKRANETGSPLHRLGPTPGEIGELAALREAGRISAKGAGELFVALCERPGGKSVEAVAGALGLLVVRDDAALGAAVDRAIAENPGAAADVRAGRHAAAGRIIGAAMKLAGSGADAKTIRDLVMQRLGGTT